MKALNWCLHPTKWWPDPVLSHPAGMSFPRNMTSCDSVSLRSSLWLVESTMGPSDGEKIAHFKCFIPLMYVTLARYQVGRDVQGDRGWIIGSACSCLLGQSAQKDKFGSFLIFCLWNFSIKLEHTLTRWVDISRVPLKWAGHSMALCHCDRIGCLLILWGFHVSSPSQIGRKWLLSVKRLKCCPQAPKPLLSQGSCRIEMLLILAYSKNSF